MKWSTVSKTCSHFLLLFLLSGAAIAETAQQVLTNNDTDHVFGGDGNDVLIYTPSLNVGKYALYDGGRGINTLWLRMTQREFDSPTFQADLIILHVQILLGANPRNPVGQGPLFHFRNFNLDVRNIENVLIERINPRVKSEPVRLIYQPIPIKNPDADSLV